MPRAGTRGHGDADRSERLAPTPGFPAPVAAPSCAVRRAPRRVPAHAATAGGARSRPRSRLRRPRPTESVRSGVPRRTTDRPRPAARAAPTSRPPGVRGHRPFGNRLRGPPARGESVRRASAARERVVPPRPRTGPRSAPRPFGSPQYRSLSRCSAVGAAPRRAAHACGGRRCASFSAGCGRRSRRRRPHRPPRPAPTFAAPWRSRCRSSSRASRRRTVNRRTLRGARAARRSERAATPQRRRAGHFAPAADARHRATSSSRSSSNRCTISTSCATRSRAATSASRSPTRDCSRRARAIMHLSTSTKRRVDHRLRRSKPRYSDASSCSTAVTPESGPIFAERAMRNARSPSSSSNASGRRTRTRASLSAISRSLGGATSMIVVAGHASRPIPRRDRAPRTRSTAYPFESERRRQRDRRTIGRAVRPSTWARAGHRRQHRSRSEPPIAPGRRCRPEAPGSPQTSRRRFRCQARRAHRRDTGTTIAQRFLVRGPAQRSGPRGVRWTS